MVEKQGQMLYRHLQHHNHTIIKTQWQRQTQEDFFSKIYTSHFICKVRKGCSRFACERLLETEQNWNILTSILMTVNVVSFSFFDAQPEVQRPPCRVMAFFTASYQHLLRASTHQGPKAPSAWCGFPYHISSITPSDLQPNCPQLNWQLLSDSKSTELYHGSTPTRSLKSHVWSSSSRNNCHPVHRSLSSGASVYECTMGIF